MMDLNVYVCEMQAHNNINKNNENKTTRTSTIIAQYCYIHMYANRCIITKYLGAAFGIHSDLHIMLYILDQEI